MFDISKEQVSFNTAILVAVIKNGQKEDTVKEHLDELEFLAATIDIETIASVTQRLDKPDKKTFIGKGKLQEIQLYITENPVDVIIFDDDLSPSQVRNIEREFEGIKVYDRSLLILDIFLFRAQTAQAKTQVELARSQYLLPRLTNMWSHLERQRGGTATRGGSGEKEIETDKRIIRDNISKLKERLQKINRQGETQRKNRSQTVRVSLAGYTNVGKSTIMKLLSKEDVFAENKLFATIDSTVRKVVLNQIPFLLTDTVGFIRKLPHTLVECFKSTLDEIKESDLIVHVVDLSHPTYEDQIEVVENTLKEIGCGDAKQLIVFNKLDQYLAQLESEEDEESEDLMDNETRIRLLHETYHSNDRKCVFISAKEGLNIDELKELIFDAVAERYYQIYPNYLNGY